MSLETTFAEVLLPIPVKGTFTYRIPRNLVDFVQIGARVAVPFGRSKIYSGIVTEIHNNIPKTYEVKYIIDIIDNQSIVLKNQLDFWNWISEYYMCAAGEVMQAALPSALKLSSETIVYINPNFEGDISNLNPTEMKIVDLCAHSEEISLTQISKLIGIQKLMPIIKTLIDKKVLLIGEQLSDRFKPKLIKKVGLSEEYRDNELMLSDLLSSLSEKQTTYKQMLLLMNFLKLSHSDTKKLIDEKELLNFEDSSKSSYSTLVKKGILEVHEEIISRFPKIEIENQLKEINYSAEQQNCIEEIEKGLKEKNTQLLFGVTGSGKTEIYVHFIRKALEEGKQVLFLVPEIALTSQLINRLRIFFGDKIGVYHSRFNEFERVEIWNSVLNHAKDGESRYPVIIGARSALFLPYSNLGLVIVDEEHDSSYKQFDPAPRYNARDVAVYLAMQHKAHTILGTATPSIETYYQSQTEKYGINILNKRFGEAILPEIVLVDLKEEAKNKLLKSHFSSVLLNHVEEALAKGEQVILFQNRRGFSTRIECNDCHHIFYCKSCDVSMTYHKRSNLLKCHYCGYTLEIPQHCPVCKSIKLDTKGFGTEKIESELSIFFPEAKIVRMDYDTTRSKNSYQEIISDFEDKKIDILVGTQMVTKGLDFNSVSVVGILNADNLINFPDFRSIERSFQMMSQVSGRAGRKDIKGKVIIQSYNIEHPVLQWVKNNDYQSMYMTQILEREKFNYPPFMRIIRISVKHSDFLKLNKAANLLAKMLFEATKLQIIGPEFPLVGRVRNMYIKDVLIKIPRNSNLKAYKSNISQSIDYFGNMPDYKSFRISIDVDPM